MAQMKVTSWNIEWLVTLLDRLAQPPAPGASATVRRRYEDAQARLTAIAREIEETDADVLCVVEGANDEQKMRDFCQSALHGAYVPVTLPGGDYGQRGRQWIWFLVKQALAGQAELHSPAIWQRYTGEEAEARFGDGWPYGKAWPVNHWGEFTPSRHSHYRHPQVLRLAWQGQDIEFIGAHLKSRLVREGRYDAAHPDDPRHQLYVREALLARIKLATEAADIRLYLGRRFAQEENPAIFLMGDFNDGPGKELFERQYLFFDLVGNLQGDVFFARKFLNHALFDYEHRLRWTARFVDRIDPQRDPHILLDHIMFTQGLVNQSLPIEVKAGAGKVEHEIHDRINAPLTSRQHTSDHKPVSCMVSTRG